MNTQTRSPALPNLTLIATTLALLVSATAPSTALALPGLSQGAIGGRIARLVQNTDAIRPFVERADLPRLLTFRRLSQTALNSYISNGAGHMMTLQSLQALVLSFRFSESMWNRIVTQSTSSRVQDIKDQCHEIAAQTGLDRTVYLRITASILETLYEHFQALQSAHIPEALKARITELSPALGRALGVARTGDHQRTWSVANPLFEQLQTLDPLLMTIDMSNDSFQMVAEIQGLIEYYHSYSRTEVAGAGTTATPTTGAVTTGGVR